MMELTIDPKLASNLDKLNLDEYGKLEKNIVAEGCRDPLVVWNRNGEKVLVDGIHRYQICKEHDIPFTVKDLEFDSMKDALVWQIDNQAGRRNWTTWTKRLMIEKRLKLKPEQSDRQTASKLNVSHSTVGKVRKNLEDKGELDNLASRIGADGKKRTRKPQRAKQPKVVAMRLDKLNAGSLSVPKTDRRAHVYAYLDEFVDQDMIDQIRGVPDLRFIFIADDAKKLANIDWPENADVGVLAQTQKQIEKAAACLAQIKAQIKFLSCEPVEELDIACVCGVISPIAWLVVGARNADRKSGATEFQPKWEWVEKLLRQARATGIPVFWRPNLMARPQEYPTQ